VRSFCGGQWCAGLPKCGAVARSEDGHNTTRVVQVVAFACCESFPIIPNNRLQPALLASAGPRRVVSENPQYHYITWGSPLSLQILHYPHPVLRHRSKPLKRVDAELRKIVEEMFELMYQHEGVGLAANQVDLPYRVFVTNVEGDKDAKEAERVYINPVLSGGHGQTEDEEGCLSVPGIYAPVVRKETIKVQAYDLAGNEIVREVSGLEARVLQHETDHLDGTLFIDRLSPTQAAAVREQLEEFELVFRSQRQTGEMPSDEAIASRLNDLERLRT
jgi:peptide deformylase